MNSLLEKTVAETQPLQGDHFPLKKYSFVAACRQNLPFLLPALICWLLLLLLIVYTDKAQLHLWINKHHSPLADAFFPYYTEAGGWFPFLLAAGLLFWRYSAAIMLVATQLIATIFVTPLKHLIDEDRPRVLFEQLQEPLHTVVRLHSSHSFPSGHTAAAFALFLSLALLVGQPMWKFLLLLLAVLAGFSRVYLSQHFTEDVFAGSVIGVMSVLIYDRFFKENTEEKLADKSLRDIFKGKGTMVSRFLYQYRFSILVALIILYISVLKPAQLPRIPLFPYADKVIHLLMYGFLALFLNYETIPAKQLPAWLFPKLKGIRLPNVKTSQSVMLLIVLILPILMGGIIELLQQYCFPPRTGDWIDFLANTTGVLLAYLLFRKIRCNFF
jgi:membrane-associated phospholipid phosphatase/VanZ family protein